MKLSIFDALSKKEGLIGTSFIVTADDLLREHMVKTLKEMYRLPVEG